MYIYIFIYLFIYLYLSSVVATSSKGNGINSPWAHTTTDFSLRPKHAQALFALSTALRAGTASDDSGFRFEGAANYYALCSCIRGTDSVLISPQGYGKFCGIINPKP